MPPNTWEPRDYDKQSTVLERRVTPPVDQYEFENRLVYIATETLSSKDKQQKSHTPRW